MGSKGFVDIHCHCLPQIDDGSRSMEMTVNMLHDAEKDGIKKVICTPHYNFVYDYNMEDLKDIFENVKNEIKQENIDIELILGNEIFLHKDIIKNLNEKKINTIGDTKYVLVEFPFERSYKQQGLDEYLYDLIVSGYTPIVAHPERYTDVQEDMNKVIEWLDLGCLLQVNRNSVIGSSGKRIEKIAYELIKRDMVHFVSSDAHRETGSRPIKLSDAYEVVVNKFGFEKADRIFFENTYKLLNNENIDIDYKFSIKKKRTLISMFRR